jgi:hypothetical protein
MSLEKIALAQSISQSGVVELVRAREVRLVDMLVRAHRDSKLTDRDAAVGVATISALRSFADEMERAVQQGNDAATQLSEPK